MMALGVNDVTGILGNSYELGTVDDINIRNYALNKPTFAGWYGAIISKYKEIQPHAKFFLMTMPKGDEDKNRDELYDKHAELINEIAEKFSTCLFWISASMHRCMTMRSKKRFSPADI